MWLNRQTDNFAASRHAELRLGLIYGILAYGWWGLVPLYFKQVAELSPWDVLANRIVWSAVVLLVPISLQRCWGQIVDCFRSPRNLLWLGASALAVATNWFTFIYAVSTGRVLQSSLGYFMTPLVNVLLGVLFLGERLRPWQTAALSIAVAGVANLVYSTGAFPILSIAIALSFGTYALLRKTMPIGPLVGSVVETSLMLPVGLLLVGLQAQREIVHHSWDLVTWGWLLCAGPVTAIPLLWFAGAARRLRLATMGILQYLAPTGQFLLAVFLYDESFTRMKLISFGLIWIALAIYSWDSWRAYVRSKPVGLGVLPAVAPE